MTISDDLLHKLACPVCKTKLKYESNNNRLACKICLLAFPIINEIPVLLVGESEKTK